MKHEECMILQELMQSRIEFYHHEYLNAGGNEKRQVLLTAYDDCQKIIEKLSEEDQAVITAYEDASFKASADKEVRTFAAGFQDGMRFGMLLHKLESTPLNAPIFWTEN